MNRLHRFGGALFAVGLTGAGICFLTLINSYALPDLFWWAIGAGAVCGVISGVGYVIQQTFEDLFNLPATHPEHEDGEQVRAPEENRLSLPSARRPAHLFRPGGTAGMNPRRSPNPKPHTRDPMTRFLFLAVLLAPTALFAADPPAKKLTADAVVKQWTPKLDKDEASIGRTGGSPKESPDVAGYTFQYTGMTLEEVWNFYAEKCGLEERYKEKNYLISASTTKKGECVVSDRPVAGKSGGHGETMFLLKTSEYTVTVSFHLDPDGKTIQGSIAAVLK